MLPMLASWFAMTCIKIGAGLSAICPPTVWAFSLAAVSMIGRNTSIAFTKAERCNRFVADLLDSSWCHRDR